MNKRLLIIIGVLASCAILLSFIFAARFNKNRIPKIPEKEISTPQTEAETEDVFWKEAVSLERAGRLLKAKEFYQKVIDSNPQGPSVQEAQEKIWDLNIRILFSKTQMHDTKVYEVQPGDTLGKIAKSFGSTVELIKRSNGLQSDLIKPGMRLKISTAKYSILVDKSQNTLILKSGDGILKMYKVSTGINNSTPVGDFKIVNKLIDPVWYSTEAIVPPGSPKNILGSRWLGISVPGYGIHGTTDPDTIGNQITAGCVRMYNRDVEELYTIVPVGTEVTVVD